MSELVLYGSDGRPLAADRRSEWQRDWDRKFRAQMGDPATPIGRAVREYMKRRDIDHAEELASQQSNEGKLGPSQQAISDLYDEEVRKRQSREHPVVHTFGCSDNQADGHKDEYEDD